MDRPSDISAIREEGGRTAACCPAMPSRSYRDLADEDVKAMVAYLRSLPPIYNAISAKSHYEDPLPASWGPPLGRVEAPPKADTVAYGGYLAGPVARCMDCHTQRRPGEPTRLGARGKEFHGPWGISVSANLTPSGLGDWSRGNRAAIRTGISRDGHNCSRRCRLPRIASGRRRWRH